MALPTAGSLSPLFAYTEKPRQIFAPPSSSSVHIALAYDINDVYPEDYIVIYIQSLDWKRCNHCCIHLPMSMIRSSEKKFLLDISDQLLSATVTYILQAGYPHQQKATWVLAGLSAFDLRCCLDLSALAANAERSRQHLKYYTVHGLGLGRAIQISLVCSVVQAEKAEKNQ